MSSRNQGVQSYVLWLGIGLGTAAALTFGFTIYSSSIRELTTLEVTLFSVTTVILSSLASGLMSAHLNADANRTAYVARALPAFRRIKALDASSLMIRDGIRRKRRDMVANAPADDRILDWLDAFDRMFAQQELQLKAAIEDWEELIPDGGSIHQDTIEESVNTMTWQAFELAVQDLLARIQANPVRGGFRPDVIACVGPGGGIVGGLMHFLSQRSIPTLWLDVQPGAELSLARFSLPSGGQRLKVLLVDDSMKSGTAMRKAKDIVERVTADIEVEVQTAVLVYRAEFLGPDNDPPDFYAVEDYEQLPYAQV